MNGLGTKRLGVAAVLALLSAGWLVGPSLVAHAEGPTAEEIVIAGSLAADGMLHVEATITFAAGQAPATLVQTLATTRPAMDYRYNAFTISGIKATAGSTDLGAAVSRDGSVEVISVDTAKAAGAPIVISYDVKGAATDGGVAEGGAALTAVSWPVVQGLNVAVTSLSGEVKVPGRTLSVNCQSGLVTGLEPCQTWASGTHDSPSPSFTDQELPAGGVVVLSFTLPRLAVAVNEDLREHWTLGRAFSAKPAPLGAALGALALGGLLLWLLWRAVGREDDARIEPAVVASFVPVGPGEAHFEVADDVRPGHIGTVVDEHVDPVDVTATLLDLAMRGYLRIVELPAAGPHAPLDWTFQRLAGGKGELRPFEATLLNAVAPADGEAVKVSEIGASVTAVIPTVRDQLYDDVVANGWFARRPDQVRSVWHTAGWVALGVAGVALLLLVIFTRFGLLGLALVGLAVALLWLAQTMPRRTRQGAALLKGLQVAAMAIQTQPTNQVPKATAYEEISSVLPYAVVLGGRGRWLQALADADNDPGVPDPEDLTWYHAPYLWNLQDLPAAFDGFLTTVQGRLYARD